MFPGVFTTHTAASKHKGLGAIIVHHGQKDKQQHDNEKLEL